MNPQEWIFSDYKVPEGKLLRLEFRLDRQHQVLCAMRLHGDFFLHPEEAQEWVEETLAACPLNEVETRLERLFRERSIEAYGFCPKDIRTAIDKALEQKGRPLS